MGTSRRNGQTAGGKVWLLRSLIVILGLNTTAQSENTEWPMWRGSNQDGKFAQNDVFPSQQRYGLRVTWRKKLGSGYSSVSVAGGRAFTMFSDDKSDYLIALEAETGVELWRYTIDTVYRGHDNSHDGPIATPTIDDQKVFGLGRRGKLFALDVETGTKLWVRDLKKDFNSRKPVHGFGTSPFVFGKTLLLQSGGPNGKSVAALNKRTGEILWTVENEPIMYESAALIRLAGQDQLVCIGGKNIFGLQPESGGLLWKHGHTGGGGSAYQVLVDKDKLFLSSTSHESMLVRVQRKGHKFKAEELWRTRNMRQSHNLSVYHEGYIYGYSNRFLTCIDAETGNTAWKSRPPGPGFLILVDNHLVILTRKGRMHVAEASPDRYKEEATLQIFEPHAWTPPSFANGRIYVRSLQEIACIEVGKVTPMAVDVQVPQSQPVAAKSEFADFISRLDKSSDKTRSIEEFLAAQESFPIIENEILAHVVYQGQAGDIAIRGDMFDTGVEIPMERVKGTNFYHHSFTLEADARVEYQLVRDLDEEILDPLNSERFRGVRREHSVLAMPQWIKPAHLEELATINRGRLETLRFESKVLEETRTIEIYLPSGYQKDGQFRYPVLYVNDGKEAVDLAKLPNTLDNLTGKEIQPVIAVLVHANPEIRYAEYLGKLRNKYAQMVTQELVPYIDQNYRTLTEPEARAIMGTSEGGHISIHTAIKHPGMFGLVAGQSTSAMWSPGVQLRNLVEQSQKFPVLFYLDWGKYDERQAETGDTDRIKSNRALVSVLKKKGYKVVAVEANEGFGWGSWRNRTDRILRTFFPLKESTR